MLTRSSVLGSAEGERHQMASYGHSYLPRGTHIKGAKAEHCGGAPLPAGPRYPRRFLALCAALCACAAWSLELNPGDGERLRFDERSFRALSDAGA